MSRATPHLCAEPGCPVVLDGPGRCPRHRATAWDTWRAGQDPAKSSGYGHRWRTFRASLVRERGERCQDCGAVGPVEAHHVDRLGMTGPRAYDTTNILLLCHACHVRAGRRRQVA
jgi:5-methylcytosine-specific restriction endonuclease McrA